MLELRDFIGDRIEIDGRMIQYRLVTSLDYFKAKGYTDTQIDGFFEQGIADLVTQIMGLKQSCYLLRRVSYSCQSLSDGLYNLKNRLISELNEVYSFEFDDMFVENYGFE